MALSAELRAAARAQIEENPDTFDIAEGRTNDVLDHLQDDIYFVGNAIAFYAGGNLVSAVQGLKLKPGTEYLFKRVVPPKPVKTIARTRDELRRQHDEANGVTGKNLLDKHKHLTNRPRIK